MSRRWLLGSGSAAVLAMAVGPSVVPRRTGRGAGLYEGEIEGAPFRIEVPTGWDGTLLLWNRSPAFRPEQVAVAYDDPTRQWLLDRGIALAASNYRTPGGIVFAEPMADQLALLDWFDDHVGRPSSVITWGPSAGGLLAILLAERHPDRIDGAIPLCGTVAGVEVLFNLTLDFAFAVKTLLDDDSGLELVRITDAEATAARAGELVHAALGTPGGNARLALANGLAGVVPWARALQPRPDDVTSQVAEQALYDDIVYVDFWTRFRQDLEARAGGNPSSNLEVDYAQQLHLSSQRDLVRRAYEDARLDLATDLHRLTSTPRIAPDRSARRWVGRHTPSGRTTVPVLTMHTTGDGVAIPEQERRYGDQVRRAGAAHLLRQLYVERGGHVVFTPSELAVAVQVMQRRLTTGRWPDTEPQRLTATAAALGPELQVAQDWGASFQPLPATPAFVQHRPADPPRSAGRARGNSRR